MFTTSTLFAWFPWLNFYTENVVLQLLFIFSIVLFSTATTLYYASIYMFLFVLISGVFLAYYNLEVLTGFLLVVEFTAFFVVILFLLALNFEGRLTQRDNTILYWALPAGALYLLFLFVYSKPVALDFLNPSYYWDDYYQDLADDVTNDIAGLYFSIYNFNSPLFFFFGLLLFFATLVCVALFRVVRIRTQEHLVSFQYVFKFFKDLITASFLRRQNTTNQTKRKSTTRMVRNKGKPTKNATKK